MSRAFLALLVVIAFCAQAAAAFISYGVNGAQGGGSNLPFTANRLRGDA